MTLYRKPQPVPTEPGWYYARFDDEQQIEPTEVFMTSIGETRLLANIGFDKYELKEFVWFGPVEDCKEG